MGIILFSGRFYVSLQMNCGLSSTEKLSAEV